MSGKEMITALSVAQTREICAQQQLLTNWEFIILILAFIVLLWWSFRAERRLAATDPNYPKRVPAHHSWYSKRPWNGTSRLTPIIETIIFWWKRTTYWP